MSTRWSCGITLTWTPILTYTRRRLALLDAFEREVPVIAFRDFDDSVGFAVGDIDTRLNVHRRGMSVTTWSEPNTLAGVVDGPLSLLLSVLEPSDVQLASVWQMTSVPLEGPDYTSAIRAFARRTAGIPGGAGVTCEDAAILVDVSLDGYGGQVEYGIVSRDELGDRVRHPGLGRVEAPDEPPHSATIRSRLGAAPPVSVFVESRLGPRGDAQVSSSAEVWDHLSSLLEATSSLTAALSAHITFKEEA